MDPEQLIATVKAELTSVKTTLRGRPNYWESCANTVHTCAGYVDKSGIMLDDNRMQERLWIINEVQNFAYFNQDDGGIIKLAEWCEREWNRVLGSYPTHVGALRGLGQAWLSKAQFCLAKIDQKERSQGPVLDDEDDRAVDRRRSDQDHVEARAILMAAAEFLGRSVQYAKIQGCLTGELLVLRAEACISLGNVSLTRDSPPYFEDAVRALSAAKQVPGYTLPDHLSEFLRDNEFILNCKLASR